MKKKKKRKNPHTQKPNQNPTTKPLGTAFAQRSHLCFPQKREHTYARPFIIKPGVRSETPGSQSPRDSAASGLIVKCTELYLC